MLHMPLIFGVLLFFLQQELETREFEVLHRQHHELSPMDLSAAGHAVLLLRGFPDAARYGSLQAGIELNHRLLPQHYGSPESEHLK